MRKGFKVIFGILALIFSQSSRAEDFDYASTLMAAFGSGCHGNGPMSTSATAQADALISMIKSVQSDSKCSDWSSNIQTIITNSQGFQIPSSVNETNDLTARIAELENALMLETEPEIVEALTADLMEKKIELFYLGTDLDGKKWANRKATLDQFTGFANSLTAAIKSDPYCSKKYPGLVMQLGGQIISAAGSLNVWATAIGSGVMAVGAATDMILQGVDSLKFSWQLKKLNESKLTEALLCTLDRISTTYCTANTVDKRITYVSDKKVSIKQAEWQGLLLMKSLPVYNAWITHVVAGSPSSNTAMAEKKKSAIQLKATLDQSREDMFAYMAEAVVELENTSDEDMQNNIVSQLIDSIISSIMPSSNNSMGHSSTVTPFYNSFIKDTKCGPKAYFYTGIKVPELELSESCYQFIKRINGNNNPPSMETIQTRMDSLLEEAQTYVDMKFKLIKETDPESVLLEAEEGGPNGLPSTKDILELALEYINKVQIAYANDIPAHTGYVMTQTKDLITRALEIYNQTSEMSLSPIVAATKLEQLQALLAPNMKHSYIGDRLRHIVNFEIDQKLASGYFAGVMEKLLLVSMSDGVETLQIYADVNINQTKDDARGAMRSSFENLDVVGNVFARKFKQIFKHLNERVEKYPDVEAFSNTLDSLCIASLSIPNYTKFAKKSHAAKYCNGRKKVSLYKNSNIAVSYDELVNEKYSARGCSYFLYNVRNQHYQTIFNQE